MVVWRFSQHPLLDGRGGLLASGRWHSRGREILYCAPNPATALLEVIVHGAVRDVTAFAHFQFLKIDVPDSVTTVRVDDTQLPSDWPIRLDVTRAEGDQWLRAGPSSALLVRSVLVPETYNVLINPRHSAARQITLVDAFAFPLDPGLLLPSASPRC